MFGAFVSPHNAPSSLFLFFSLLVFFGEWFFVNVLIRWIVPIFLFLFLPVAFAQAPWDFLRPVAQIASQVDPLIKPIVFFLSLALMVIAFLGYKKTKSKKSLLVALAFLFFAVKWGLKVMDVFISPGNFLSDSSENVFELLIFISLFLALFKK